VIDLKGEYIPMPKTRAFRALHSRADQPLLLPNIWDVGGAKLAELLGAKAVATTSAGMSWSLGYPDGNKLPIERQAQLANDLVKAVTVPVSIDMESGYSDDPVLVSENLKRVLDAGIAGINIEDGTGEPSLLAKKIEAIKRTASAMKVDVFVNAQTDVYLQNLVPDENKAEETLARATVYSDAGADGLFVPRLNELTQIAQITVGTRLPVNLLAWPGLPKMADLAKLGVRRLSAGPGISQIVWQQIAKVTEVFLATGDSEMFAQDSMTRGELQRLFANREVNSIVPVRLPLGHMPGLCGDRRNRTTLETEVIVKEKCKELIQCQKT
jgi:2-methylisocitrate lyase-like PEP mutase family enzyme